MNASNAPAGTRVMPAACPQCAIHTVLRADTQIGETLACRHCDCRALAADWVSQARRLMREGLRA